MSRCHRLAAVACLFLAGCTLDSFSLSALGTAKGDGGPVVAGSLAVVADSTQKTLGDMGLFVTRGRDGDAVRFAATTPGGKKFVLLLKGRKTDHGDETQLGIQWEKESDPEFWMQLTAALARPDAAPPR